MISRFIFPLFFSILITIIIVHFFSVTQIDFCLLFFLACLSGFMGLMASLMIVAISKNKVEGMALSKLSGLFMLGTAIPFFIKTPYQYLAMFMPSFWVAKFMLNFSVISLLFSLLTVVLWNSLFFKIFIKKIN